MPFIFARPAANGSRFLRGDRACYTPEIDEAARFDTHADALDWLARANVTGFFSSYMGTINGGDRLSLVEIELAPKPQWIIKEDK